MRILPDQTGNGIFNMAVFKPKIPVSQFLDEIETKFGCETYISMSNSGMCEYSATKADVILPMWRLKAEWDIEAKFQRLNPHFSGPQ